MLVFNRLVLLLSIVLVLLVSDNLFAQDRIGVGMDGIYNFQSKGIGIGLNGNYIINERLILATNIDYYPSFNTYNGLNVGVEAMMLFLPTGQRWLTYPLAVAYYQMLSGPESLPDKKSNSSNFTYEAGIGLVGSFGNYKPHIEGRYDFVWKEYIARIGLSWYFDKQDKIEKRYHYLRKY